MNLSQHEYPNGLVLVAETMPGVQSAAFSLLLPAGAAYEPEGGAGAASMLADWITRGAGDRDSRALLTALDNLGVNHGESAQTLHTSLSAATLGRNLIPALDIFADVVLRPHLDDDEIEPIRSLALQNLQSLEDDPGSKVIYELRRRHFPDPWGRPSPGTPEGVAGLTPDALRERLPAELPAQRRHPRRGRRDRLAGAPRRRRPALRRLGASPRAPRGRAAHRPGSRSHRARDAADPDRPGLSDGPRRQPRLLPGPRGDRDPRRLLVGPPLHRGPREARALLHGLRQLREPARPRGRPLLRRHLRRPRQETLDVTLAEIARLGESGVELEELETMRAGLKSSLIMQQESSMGRSGSIASDWFHLGRVRSLDEISSALDALTPESVGAFAAESAAKDLTILTLGPNPLVLP